MLILSRVEFEMIIKFWCRWTCIWKRSIV